ncbi:hypothetical protein EYF80_046703 [Liparis tanakae]|uniref:Uncharacterized protein n=1 Tax=Liparis tanakae TaxID=230148 RepID=A0A4Z2FQ95_9TELE|nr:hypothetical protein EYF80_046703 [Liparis tanakae]
MPVKRGKAMLGTRLSLRTRKANLSPSGDHQWATWSKLFCAVFIRSFGACGRAPPASSLPPLSAVLMDTTDNGITTNSFLAAYCRTEFTTSGGSSSQTSLEKKDDKQCHHKHLWLVYEELKLGTWQMMDIRLRMRGN